MRLGAVLMSAMVVGCALTMLTGCESSDSGESKSRDGLPENPKLEVREGSSRELWMFAYKDYDNTFRIRWPSHFANSLGVGPGSYNLINGERAEFRSFDTDHGSNRASYSLPGPFRRIGEGVEMTCVLYSAEGVALAWFKTYSTNGSVQGPLP